MNDETVTDITTATFKVVFIGLDLIRPFNGKAWHSDKLAREERAVSLYEVTKHGDTTYSVISNECSPMDSLPIRFIVTIGAEGCKASRILKGFEGINLEYEVRPGADKYSFKTSVELLLAFPSSETSSDYENEAIEAFKVGTFVNELVKLGSWDIIQMEKEDDLEEWVDIERPKGHAMEPCNGWSLVESTKADIY